MSREPAVVGHGDGVVNPAAVPAGRCSAVRLSTIIVPDLGEALAFYRDTLGLQCDAVTEWSGPGLTDRWRLPAGAIAHAAVLSAGGRPSGRILLLEVEGGGPVPPTPPRWFLGHNNINVYTTDMSASVEEIRGQGRPFWSEPLRYEIGTSEGSPTEVFFDGPGDLPVNLIEPSGDPSTVVGEVAARYAELGATPTGYSEVTTSGISVRSIDRALEFYVDALGLRVLMDFDVTGADRNGFLDLPPDAVTRNTFLVGDDLIGKVALMEARNHDVPEISAESTVPPALGCAATTFVVRDLDATLHACDERGVQRWGDVEVFDHPAFGAVSSALLRVPGSGALVELVAGV